MLKRWLAELRRVRAGAERPSVAADPPLPRLDDSLAAAGIQMGDWLLASRKQPRLYAAVASDSLARAIDRQPDLVAAAIAQAERVLRHEFDLLGSGSFVPADPD